jgi:recombination protein RecA
MNDAKIKEIEKFVIDNRKIFGEESIFLPKFKPVNMEWIQTGVHSIDDVCGAGIPRGRIIEIYGPEASGKTTLGLTLLSAVQRALHPCMFIDAEHALDPTYARKLGVDIDNMPISQPSSAEEATNLLLASAKSGLFGLIVVDSVASMVPQAEIDGEIGDKHMALLAQIMSATLRQLAGICKASKTTVVFTNQIRYKVGVYWGSPEFQPGGIALKFYSSIRIDIRKKDTISEGNQFKGIVSRLKVVKNKVAPPFKEAMINIMFGAGIDGGGDTLEHLKRTGRLEVRGSSYFLDGALNIGTSKDKANQWVKEHFTEYESGAVETKAKVIDDEKSLPAPKEEKKPVSTKMNKSKKQEKEKKKKK